MQKTTNKALVVVLIQFVLSTTALYPQKIVQRLSTL